LASVFRTIHTIKGTSGFLAFNHLEAVTHVGESLLSRLRDGLLRLNPAITTALLAMVDAVRQMLGSIEATGNEGEREDQELIGTLTRLLQAEGEAKPAPEPVPAKPVPAKEKEAELRSHDSPQPVQVGEALLDKAGVKPSDAVEALSPQPQAHGQSASDSTIRVDVSQLDRLMNRMGELVLLRNQIVQFTNSSEDSDLIKTSQRLNLLTTELQEGVMKTRMQPIDRARPGPGLRQAGAHRDGRQGDGTR